MTDSLVKVDQGTDDIRFHDPAVSAVQQTFDRVKSGGGTLVGVKKLGANSIPGLDPAYVASGRGGFYELHSGAPTQTNLTVEAMLRLLRKQSRRVVNFEGLGGIPNDSTDATGEINRAIWDLIMTEFATTRGGFVYFPTVGDAWYFKRPAADSGVAILPFYRFATANDRTPEKVGIIGDGPLHSVIKGCPGATSSDHLLKVRGRGLTLVDIRLDRNVNSGGSNGHAVRFEEADGQPVQYTRIFNVWLAKGGQNLSLGRAAGSVTPQVNSNWQIGDLTLELAFGKSATLQNLNGLLMNKLRWFALNSLSGGFLVEAVVNGDAVADVTASDIQGYTGGGFSLSNFAPTFSASLHGRHKIAALSVPDFLTVDNVDRVELARCVPFAMLALFSKPGIVFSKLRILDCEARGNNGLLINVTDGASLLDWVVRGGSYDRNIGPGIEVVSASGAAASLVRQGRIQGVNCSENGQSGAAPGILLRTSGATLTNTLKGTIISGCNLWDRQGGKTQSYGVQEVANAANTVDQNLIDGDVFETNLTAPWLTAGAATVIGTNVYM